MGTIRNYNLRVNHEVCVGSQCRHPPECPSFLLCQYPQHHRPAGACQRRLLQLASADQQSEGFRHNSRVEKNESTVSSIWERPCGVLFWGRGWLHRVLSMLLTGSSAPCPTSYPL